jgi:hypothetical protein
MKQLNFRDCIYVHLYGSYLSLLAEPWKGRNLGSVDASASSFFSFFFLTSFLTSGSPGCTRHVEVVVSESCRGRLSGRERETVQR